MFEGVAVTDCADVVDVDVFSWPVAAWLLGSRDLRWRCLAGLGMVIEGPKHLLYASEALK